MKWTQKEIDDLKVDWLFYKQGKMTSDDLKKRYQGRTIDSLSRKYWKVYGRLGLKVEKKTDFVSVNIFEEE